MEEARKEEMQNDIPETVFPNEGLIIPTETATGARMQEVTTMITTAMAEGILMVQIKAAIQVIGITAAEMIMQPLLLIIKTEENKTAITVRDAGKQMKPIQIITARLVTIPAEEI